MKVYEDAKGHREILQLKRLETLTDVVYGIVIWRLFVLIPKPSSEQQWDSVGAFISANLGDLLLVLIGLVVTIIYWGQSNALFGALARTDTRHTVLSILQIFFLLVFLYSLKLGIDLGATAGTRAFESGSAAVVGILGAAAWIYAIHNRRLLLPEVTEQDARELGDRVLAEPVTALITIPFAFLGALYWEPAWLSYIFVVRFLKRRRVSRSPASK
jgi:uncharacterized membrane protein